MWKRNTNIIQISKGNIILDLKQYNFVCKNININNLCYKCIANIKFKWSQKKQMNTIFVFKNNSVRRVYCSSILRSTQLK